MTKKASGSRVLEDRRRKAEQLEQEGMELFPNDFIKDTNISHILNNYHGLNSEQLQEIQKSFSLAGRIVSLRSFGKASFFHLNDHTGSLQIFVQKNLVGDENYATFKKLDIGDIIGVTGRLFRTKTDELTLNAYSFLLVTKSFRPLPEKYHGLKDLESRYRQRYVDLIVNPEIREIFHLRTQILGQTRSFLEEHNFMEVETPMMQPIPGGATAKPFETYHNALNMELYLRVAPELYLKRLLVGGFEKIFEINRNFRNEGISTQHNPEFTMLEFYWAYTTYRDLMDFTEKMFIHLARQIKGTLRFEYQSHSIDFTPPWRRFTFHDALEQFGKLHPEDYTDREKAERLLLRYGENVQIQETLGKIQAKLFDILVEPQLIQPHFIYQYPADISPLSRKNPEDQSLTERFELFVAGREMANAFSELNDPREQKQRFQEQVEAKAKGDQECLFMDEDYIRALEYGMPPAAGEGVGIDRLVMLFTNSTSIREVILFPHLKPENLIE